MKPDWDKLIGEFKDHPTIGIFDVDCTSNGGTNLCSANGVGGYPTIKYGDPNNLEDYSGGRDYDALKAHADGLKPVCSPSQREHCTAEQIAEIEGLLAKGADGLVFVDECGGYIADHHCHAVATKTVLEMAK